VISCPKCGKENQDHYKFCLGCGNELPRDAGAARPFHPTPPAGVPAAAPPGPAVSAGSAFGAGPAVPPRPAGAAPQAHAAPAASPFAPQPAPPRPEPGPAQPPPQAVPGAPAAGGFQPNCPQCGTPNPRAQRFCMTCGFDNSTAPAAAAAPPPQAAFVPPSAPAAMPAPAAGPQPSRARLVLIRPDGSEGGMFQLNEGNTVVGRDTAPLFASDTYLSPRHATFTVNGTTVGVRDENSLNGIYVRIERQTPTEIQDGEVFRIGQEILRFEAFRPAVPEADGTEKQGAQLEGLVGRISLVVGRETTANAFPVPIGGLYLGRERGDILFPEDGYVSGLHCQLSVENGKLIVTDVGSSNGSYVRMGRGDRMLKNNDLLLMGQQLFRLTL